MQHKVSQLFLVATCITLVAAAETAPSHSRESFGSNPPVSPAQPWQIGIYLVTAFALLLAAAGGVGAVAMLVTLYMIIGGPAHVPASTAVGMVSCVFAGTGIVHVAYYSRQKHPVYKDRALIDPNLLILITAPGVGGMALGGLVNRVAPIWTVYVALALVMIVVSYSLSRKAVQAYQARQVALQVQRAASVALTRSFIATAPPRLKLAADLDGSPAEEAGAEEANAGALSLVGVVKGPGHVPRAEQASQLEQLPHMSTVAVVRDAADSEGHDDAADMSSNEGNTNSINGHSYSYSLDTATNRTNVSRTRQQPAGLQQQQTNNELRHELHKLQSFDRWQSFTVLRKKNPLKRWRTKHFVLIALMPIAAALPASAALPPCGSALWLLAVLSGLPLLAADVLFTAGWLGRYVRKTKQGLLRSDSITEPGTVPDQWTFARLVWVPSACLAAGILTGFIGSGGAFVLARIALSIDTHPAAMAATLQSSVIGWGLAGLCMYGILGQVPWKMGAILALIAAVSTALGHATLTQWIKESGKFWIILGLLAVFGAIASVLAVYNVVIVMKAVVARPMLWKETGTMCTKITL